MNSSWIYVEIVFPKFQEEFLKNLPAGVIFIESLVKNKSVFLEHNELISWKNSYLWNIWRHFFSNFLLKILWHHDGFAGESCEKNDLVFHKYIIGKLSGNPQGILNFFRNFHKYRRGNLLWTRQKHSYKNFQRNSCKKIGWVSKKITERISRKTVTRWYLLNKYPVEYLKKLPKELRNEPMKNLRVNLPKIKLPGNALWILSEFLEKLLKDLIKNAKKFFEKMSAKFRRNFYP